MMFASFFIKKKKGNIACLLIEDENKTRGSLLRSVRRLQENLRTIFIRKLYRDVLCEIH